MKRQSTRIHDESGFMTTGLNATQIATAKKITQKILI